MAETNTPNYKWIKPDIGGDSANWGNVLNATIDAVDSVVWANQQAGLPIGSVAMFAGAAAPVNWLICDGSSLATTGTYAGLFGIIGYTYGGAGANFNLPNLVQNFPLGAGANRDLAQPAARSATRFPSPTCRPTRITSNRRRTATAPTRTLTATSSPPAAITTLSTILSHAHLCDVGRAA